MCKKREEKNSKYTRSMDPLEGGGHGSGRNDSPLLVYGYPNRNIKS